MQRACGVASGFLSPQIKAGSLLRARWSAPCTQLGAIPIGGRVGASTSQRSAGVDFKPMSGTPPETWAFHDQRIPRYERDIINMVGMGVTENAALKPKREGRRRGLLGDLCPRQDWQRRGAGGGGLDVERVNCACQTATQGTCRRVPARADDGPAPRRRWSASQAIPMEHPLSGVERDRQHGALWQVPARRASGGSKRSGVKGQLKLCPLCAPDHRPRDGRRTAEIKTLMISRY